MTKMEIATYLGVSNALLSQVEKTGDSCDELLFKTVQAVQEAQLIMYELAREEILAQILGEVRGEE